jgi:hypothetical protein
MLGKSFMYNKKRRGPSIEPWGAPYLFSSQLDDMSSRTTFWYLPLN